MSQEQVEQSKLLRYVRGVHEMKQECHGIWEQ